MKKKTLSLVVAVVLTTSIMQMPVYATPEQPAEQQQASTPKGEVDKIRKDMKTKQQEMTDLSIKTSHLVTEKQENDGKIEKLNKEIEGIQKEIDKEVPKIKEKEEILGKRIRELYKSGGATSYFSVFTGTDTTSDIIEKMDTVSILMGIDRKAIDDYVKHKEKYENDIKAIEKKKSELSKVELRIKRDMKVIEKQEGEIKKATEEYKKAENELKTKYPDIFIEEERAKVLPQFNTIDSSDDYGTVESAIGQLQAMLQSGEITMQAVIDEVNSYIAKGQAKLEELNSVSYDVAAGMGIVDTAYAVKATGAGYSFGATGPDFFDCSGFTQYVFAKNGISIGRDTYSQMGYGTRVSEADLMPGDLVFSRGGSHVGIYVGNGSYIHAANPSMGIIVSEIYHDGFYCAVRV